MPTTTVSLPEAISNINNRVPGRWLTHCVGHDDKTPSLSITVKEDGWVGWRCFAACDQEQVQAALIEAGMDWGKRKETAKTPLDHLPPAGEDDPHGSFFDNPPAKPAKETTHEDIHRDVELGLVVAGGCESDFLKTNGERLIRKINALHWELSLETTINMWLLGRILNMYKNGRDGNNAKLVPHGMWENFLEKNKVDVSRAQRAMRIHKRNTLDEIQGKKTQNQALGYTCKQDADETHKGGESTPEYKKGGDKQREVETIRAQRHEIQRLEKVNERLENDVARWKKDAQEWEVKYRELAQAEHEAGGIPYGDPSPPESVYN